MRSFLSALTLLAITVTAIAADPAPPAAPVSPLPANVVLISRDALQDFLNKLNGIGLLYPPAITDSVRTSANALMACITDNSIAPGPQDQCPMVTAALLALQGSKTAPAEPKDKAKK